jgi:hypothetical protein
MIQKLLISWEKQKKYKADESREVY